MAHLTNSSMPGYVIYRETRPGQPVDPTTPPVFFPPKDSDELFDALRAKFPHAKTHSERMRDAIIEFLLEERQAEQNPMGSASASVSNAEATSPWQQSWPSVSASTLSSPETMTAMTPMFSNSPRTSLQQPSNMIRQFSTNNSVVFEASPPALENMTTVFSLSSNEQPKQRIRRKMTEAEKVEYRKRRIVKACDKCSKRKRKCHHNQPDMEHVTAKSQKVTKPSSSSKRPTFEVPRPPTKTEPSVQLRDGQDLYGSWFDETQPMEDFTALLDIENANVDPFQQPDWLFSSNDEDWQWPKSGDFTLLDDFTPDLDWGMQSSSDSSSSLQSPSFVPTQPATPQSQFVASLEGSRSSLSSAITAPSDISNGSGELGGGSGGSGGNRGGFSTSNGNAMIWEHLRTGQQDSSSSEDGEEGGMLWHNDPFFDESDNGPQHTYHAHAHTSSAAFMHDGAAGSSSGRAVNAGALRGYIAPHGTESSPTRASQPASSSSTRSIRTGDSLLDAQSLSHSPVSSSTSQEAAPAALQSQNAAIRLGGSRAGDNSSSSRSERATLPVKSPQQQPSHEDSRQAATAESIGGPLEIMQIRDYLRMKTNVSSIDSKSAAAGSNAQLLGAQGQHVPLIEQIPRPPRHSGGAQSGVGPAMNPAPGSSGEMLQEAHLSATARSSQGGQLASLGGTSLDGVASPDLYLLRRGMPSQQQSRSQLQVRTPMAQRAVNANANAVATAAGLNALLLEAPALTPEQQRQLQVEGRSALLLVSPKPAHTRARKPSASGFSNDDSNLIAQQDPRTQQQLVRLPLLDPSKISRMDMLLPTDKENLLQVRDINKNIVCNSISAILRAAEGWVPDFFTCVALFTIFIGCGCHSTAGVASVAPSVLLLALLCPTPSSTSSSSRRFGNAGGKSAWQSVRLPKVTSLLEEHKKKASSPSLLGSGAVSSSRNGASWWKLALASVVST